MPTFKFEIKNKASGRITHGYEASGANAIEAQKPHNNGWGKDPSEYEVLITDVTAIRAQEAQEETDRIADRAQLRNLNSVFAQIDASSLGVPIKTLLKQIVRQVRS